MEITAHPLYPTMFLIGHQKLTEQQSVRVGSVIVKGTFQNTEVPLPAEEQMPVFLKDMPFNVVSNSDFEAVKPVDPEHNPDVKEILFWQAVGGMVEPNTDNWVGSMGQSAKLNSHNGHTYLTQTIAFDQPMGGRTFVFSFYAKAERPVRITGIYIQAVDSGNRICEMSRRLTNSFQRFVSLPEMWPADEASTEVEIILSGTDDATNPVYFDRVQLEETTNATQWDEETVFRYEHDLVPYKPNADVVILGAAQPPDDSLTAAWFAVIETDTGRRMTKQYSSSAPPREEQSKITFGWASRGLSPRLEEAGTPDELKDFKPTEEKALPLSFKDTFYNGYDREYEESLSVGIPFPYFTDGASFTITSRRNIALPALDGTTVQLPKSRPTATLIVLNNSNQEEEQNIALSLDTVIVERELNRYMVVWRGHWLFETENQERYLKLIVQGGI